MFSAFYNFAVYHFLCWFQLAYSRSIIKNMLNNLLLSINSVKDWILACRHWVICLSSYYRAQWNETAGSNKSVFRIGASKAMSSRLTWKFNSWWWDQQGSASNFISISICVFTSDSPLIPRLTVPSLPFSSPLLPTASTTPPTASEGDCC